MSVTRRPEYSRTFQSTGSDGISFGFDARRVEFRFSSGPLYLSFQSTVVSTDGFMPSTGQGYMIVDDGAAMGGIAFGATSTGITINLLALGG